MVDKFLRRDPVTGQIHELEAKTSSAGAADEGRVVALGTGGVLDDTMLPTGIGPEVQVAVAGELLADNDLVYFYDDAGTTKAAKASADVGGNAAHGIILVGAALGGNVTVYMSPIKVPDMLDDAGNSVAAGARTFLSATVPGKVTTTPVTGPNKLHQRVGRGLGADGALVHVDESVKLA